MISRLLCLVFGHVRWKVFPSGRMIQVPCGWPERNGPVGTFSDAWLFPTAFLCHRCGQEVKIKEGDER